MTNAHRTPRSCPTTHDAEGCFHLAGRAGGYGKVRGNRVEPAEVEQALEPVGERVAAAHRAAIESYLLRDRFGGRLTYLLSTGDPVEEPDPRVLWANFVRGGVGTVPVPGHHGHFHREPQLSAVTAGLRRALAAAA